MNCDVISSLAVLVMIIIFFISPDIGCKLAKRISKSGMMTIIAAMFGIGSVGFASLIYLMTKSPKVQPWELAIMVIVFIFMATMGMFSLAFIATIPEQMEKEADSE